MFVSIILRAFQIAKYTNRPISMGHNNDLKPMLIVDNEN